LRTDVCIVGGGSAGIGAAIGAARAGAKVIVVERQGRLGGTSVNAYVNNWEPGVDNVLAREIYERMSKIPNAVGVVTDHNKDRKMGAFGLWLFTPGLKYEETVRRSGLHRSKWRALAWEPEAFCKVVGKMLDETGNCRVMLNTSFTEADVDGTRVRSIKAVSKDGREYRIQAGVFIDCSGGGHLCRAVGCETMLGS
jgi:NADPH-dependent 2,4-dienoyl-CoA reductase/sulfur reductase-like enzyme